jgi:hypothetical protein
MHLIPAGRNARHVIDTDRVSDAISARRHGTRTVPTYRGLQVT